MDTMLDLIEDEDAQVCLSVCVSVGPHRGRGRTGLSVCPSRYDDTQVHPVM